MSAIRILIVDDSVIARRLIEKTLSAHSQVEVVGAAASGQIALTRLASTPVDCVLLDVEMPEMDGIETLKRIRQSHPKLPVIMFSSLTERGAKTTFDALDAGANDYACKPSSQKGEDLPTVVKDVLLPKIEAVTAGRRGGAARPAAAAPPKPVVPITSPKGPKTAPDIVVIASSTGGPNALNEVIPLLPESLSVPVVMVQHMPPIFTRCLAERLDQRSKLKVIESAGNEEIKPGYVYVAPGDFHVELVQENGVVRTRLNTDAPEQSCRPAADVLFRSAARIYGARTLGVVLTGMGHDGLDGAQHIVQAGGRIIAQSGPTCVVWGMPRAVEEAGLCEEILPLDSVAAGIARRVDERLVRGGRSGTGG